MKHPYFKPWIAGLPVLMRISLFLILMSSLAQFGIFAMTSNYALSLAGAQPEDISFALLVTYVGILVTLPVQFRFLRYFETRNYLLFNIMMGMLLGIACSNTSDMVIFTLVRFFQGIVICNIAGCMLIIIFSTLKTEKTQVIGSSVFYGSILSSGTLIGLAVSMVVSSYDWTLIYTYFMIFQVFTLVLALLIFKARTGHKRYPLYQIDWLGCVLLIAAGCTIAYTMIYGPKYYWFDDQRIVASAITSILTLGGFVFRMVQARRPLVNPDVFRFKNFVVGLVLLAFYYGIKDSINLIYAYTSTVVKWSVTDTVFLALCNITGLVLAMAVTAQLLLRYRHRINYFFLVGFGLMLVYHLYIFFMLAPDLSFNDLVWPILIQGMASGTLIMPIIIFILSSAPPHTGTSGVVVAAYTRFTATLNSVAGFYTLQLFFNRSHRQSLLRGLIPEDSAVMDTYVQRGMGSQSEGIAYAALNRLVTTQGQLLTIRSVFLIASGLLILVLLLILLVPSINKTVLHWNKRMFVLPRK